MWELAKVADWAPIGGLFAGIAALLGLGITVLTNRRTIGEKAEQVKLDAWVAVTATLEKRIQNTEDARANEARGRAACEERERIQGERIRGLEDRDRHNAERIRALEERLKGGPGG